MNLWSSWKPSFLSKVFFPWVFFGHFSNSRFKHDYLVNSTFARPVKLVPSAHLPRFFFRRDYTENFAPIGPSWALAHIQTAVPKLPGVWYMQLGPGFFTEGQSCSTCRCRLKIIIIRKRHLTSQKKNTSHILGLHFFWFFFCEAWKTEPGREARGDAQFIPALKPTAPTRCCGRSLVMLDGCCHQQCQAKIV